MNRSVLYSATAIIVIALAAGLSLVILRQGRDELANHAPQPRVRPESGKPGAIKQLVGESVEFPVHDDPGSPEDGNLDTPEKLVRMKRR